MQLAPDHFKENAKAALADRTLKLAIDRTTGTAERKRAEALALFPEFTAARERGRQIKDHVIAHLDHYLLEFERNATAAGTKVHWAATADEACRIVIEICRSVDARRATRAKSMLGEEIGLPHALAAAGIERVETDLAEHIIQLADEPPSHIVWPAMHRTREQISVLFEAQHRTPPASGEPAAMVQSARRELREKFFSAEVGISGANFLVADTGAVCTVTNEGNAELTTTPPKVHIVTAGIEKLVPTTAHAFTMLRLLVRSATGGELTQYTTFHCGPKRPGDRDGPSRDAHRARRQWPLEDAGERASRYAALHPLRRLSEPLRRLPADRRSCLRLGLPRPDGRGSDSGADRPRHSPRSRACLHVERALRGGMPGGHSAAGTAARMARSQLARGVGTDVGPPWHRLVGVRGPTAAALPAGKWRRRPRDAFAQAARLDPDDAPGWRLDGSPGLPGTERPNLHGTVPGSASVQGKLMGTRDRVLEAVRAGLGDARRDPGAIAAESRALLATLDLVRPKLPEKALAELFAERVAAPNVGCTVERRAGLVELPDAVRGYLLRHGLPASIAVQPAAELDRLDWSGIETRDHMALDESVGVGLAKWGVAETGSLVFHSGFDMPILFNFLPLHHVVALRTSAIVAYLEDYAAIAGPSPRNVNIITGASGTTDIEGSYVRGAHGPGFLHVVLVEDLA